MCTYVVFEERKDEAMDAVERCIDMHKLIAELRQDVLGDDTHLNGSPSVNISLHLLPQLELIEELPQVVVGFLSFYFLLEKLLSALGILNVVALPILFKVLLVFFLDLVFLVEARGVALLRIEVTSCGLLSG